MWPNFTGDHLPGFVLSDKTTSVKIIDSKIRSLCLYFANGLSNFTEINLERSTVENIHFLMNTSDGSQSQKQVNAYSLNVKPKPNETKPTSGCSLQFNSKFSIANEQVSYSFSMNHQSSDVTLFVTKNSQTTPVVTVATRKQTSWMSSCFDTSNDENDGGL